MTGAGPGVAPGTMTGVKKRALASGPDAGLSAAGNMLLLLAAAV